MFMHFSHYILVCSDYVNILGQNTNTTQKNNDIEVFWAVAPCSVVAGSQNYSCIYCVHLYPDDGGSTDLCNSGIL